MASLTGFPDEILLEVIAGLSIQAIGRLSQTCRRLHRLCDMTTRRKYRRLRLRTSEHVDTAFDVLMSILRKPHRGTYIRHLEVDDEATSIGFLYDPSIMSPYDLYNGGHESRRSLSDSDMMKLRTAIRAAGFVGAREEQVVNMVIQKSPSFASRTCFCPGQALGALLISVCPYLESLVLSPPCDGGYWDQTEKQQDFYRWPLGDVLNDANTGRTTHLQHLRQVGIFHDFDEQEDGDGDWCLYYKPYDFLATMSLFHRLPALETVEIEGVTSDNFDSSVSGLGVESTNISRIRFTQTELKTPCIISVICSCRRLREFKYDMSVRGPRCGMNEGFHQSSFLQAILRHRSSLEVLDVDMDFYTIGEDLRWDADDPWPERSDDELDQSDFEEPEIPEALRLERGSLRDFTALTHLTIDAMGLFFLARGTKPAIDTPRGEQDPNLIAHLPPNLEYLCIWGYDRAKWHDRGEPQAGYYESQFAHLMEHRETKLPSLKVIKGIDEYIPSPERQIDFSEWEGGTWPKPVLEEWSDHEYD